MPYPSMAPNTRLALELQKAAGRCRTEPDPRFTDLAKRLRNAKARGHLLKAELEEVCRWKSARALPLVKDNTEREVRKSTAAAFRTRNERERIVHLCQLHGVAVPMASAILAAYDPDEFGVIDVRAWRVLRARHQVRGNNTGKGLSVKNWLNYLEVIRCLAKQVGTTPRLVEISLFKLDESLGPRAHSRKRGSCPPG